MGYKKLSGLSAKEEVSGLRGAALKFIRDYCENLRFSPEKETREENEGIYLGAGIEPDQIPYNMQMDIDRLCLERVLSRFLESGRKEDAFDVYFCYLEMFVGDYEKTRRMIELLSEYEANGSGLLMKHRDHYSHSVYVFSLGLATYVSSSAYRNAYREYYRECRFADDNEMACHFLEYWGMTALFHDIGYPFELPFEQVSSYFEVGGEERSQRPFLAYKGLSSFCRLDKSMQRKIGTLLRLSEDEALKTTDELFAHDLYRKLGNKYYFSEEEILDFLKKKPTEPDRFGFYMDHAYFSATVLFRKLFCDLKCTLKKEHIDSLTAILLHNSLYKFCVAYYKNPDCNMPLDMKLHPLAYMLMLCDELQCWDRTAYGRNSKNELHPMEAEIDISEDNLIKITYIFDPSCGEKIKKYIKDYEVWRKDFRGEKPRIKAYSAMHQTEKIHRCDGTEAEVNEFQADIERIVDLSQLGLKVEAEVKELRSGKHKGYLSDSNFMNLYNFAAALNARWSGKEMTDEEMYREFRMMSLEYKLSNINQAKSFAKYLNEIGAFYTNRSVDFEMLDKFDPGELSKIGILEHERWLREHYEMGWGYISREELEGIVKQETGFNDITSSDFSNAVKTKREVLRRHWDMIPDFNYSEFELTKEMVKSNYERIGQIEQDKDTKPMEHMIGLLKKFDGLRIYRLG